MTCCNACIDLDVARADQQLSQGFREAGDGGQWLVAKIEVRVSLLFVGEAQGSA